MLRNTKVVFWFPLRLLSETYLILSRTERGIVIKGKVKFSRYRPRVAQRVGIALLFHDCGTWRGWVVSSTPRLHFIPGKDQVPIVQETGWAPGPVWTGGKFLPHRDSILDRPARCPVTITTELPGPQQDIVINCIRLHVSTRYSCQIATKLEFSRQIFEKSSNIKFHENPSIWSPIVPCRRIDGRSWRR